MVHWSPVAWPAKLDGTPEILCPDGEGAAIVAFLDATASARPVLETALRLDDLLDAGVRAMHVRGPGGSEATPADLAARRGVELRVVDGSAPDLLLQELAVPGVKVAVMGARATTGGRRPVGSVTRHVIHRSGRPVLIVPPEVVDSRPLKSALVPVEGTAQTSGPLESWLPRLSGQVDLIGLHVFTPDSIPAMLDRPVRDMLMIADCFQERHLPGADRLEMRSGHVASEVIECSRERGVDMIILSWMQPGTAGRAQTVLEVLGRSLIPTLLLPGRPPTP